MPTRAVTIRDVAEAAGVSKTTAVYVLNNTPHFNVPDATRRRVHDAASRLGYRRNAIASALSRGRIHTIGVVLPFYPESGDQAHVSTVYAKAMLVAISVAAQEVGLRITVVPITPENPVSITDVTDGRVDGLILVQVHDPASVSVLYDAGLPCVAITAEHCPRSVRPDNRGGAALAVEHLVGLGHRRIVHRRNPQDNESCLERIAGFQDAVAQFGLDPAECPVVASPAQLLACLQLEPERRPTAVFAFNDVLAVEALRMARREGLRTPEDLSVVGFDNTVLASVCEPPLTTVHNSLAELASAAIETLQSLWRGEEPPPTEPVPTWLVVRSSTAPPATTLSQPITILS